MLNLLPSSAAHKCFALGFAKKFVEHHRARCAGSVFVRLDTPPFFCYNIFVKLVYILTLIVTELIVTFTIFRVVKKKQENFSLSKKMCDLLCAAFLTVFPNIFIACAPSAFFAMIFFSWYFCLIDIMLFFLLYFIFEYTSLNSASSRHWTYAFALFFKNDIKFLFDKKKQKTFWFEKLMLVFAFLIVADIISFALNIFTKKVFTAETFYHDSSFFSADSYFRISSGFVYDIHLSLSYILVALIFICLAQKIILSPNLYRIKYLGVALFILVIVVVNSFYILFELPVDFSVVLYGLVCVAIYYFSFGYIPAYLRRESVNRVVQNMKNGILVFDNEDRCILINDYARALCDVQKNKDPKTALKFFMKNFSEGKKFSECDPYEQNIQIEKDGTKIYIRFSFSRMETKSGRFIGSYFLLLDVSEEIKREKLEHYRNTHDALTGIYNKERFYDKVAQILQENPLEKYCILCSDIGNFKLLNELYGIAMGDKILKLIALALREKAVPGEVYGRIDNDRFAMLLPKSRLNEQVFFGTLERIFKHSLNLALTPTCYLGAYEVRDLDTRVSFMCDRAFIAIDTIKGQYAKRIAWYNDTLRNSVLREQELVYQLDDAISTEQIKIFLQPQTTFEGAAVGAEALVRWEHPNDGLVLPAQFIPVFEKNGMIVKIDLYVWRMVFKRLEQWQKSGHENLYVCVNLSQKDFYLMNICQEFGTLLKEFKINPKNFHIEITESVMMMDFGRQIKLIEDLRAMGFTIEIGDFGTGYSSLKVLRDCNVDILKLDINFLEKAPYARNAHIIIKQFVAMAHNLGIKVLAKGIEKKEQLDLLCADGCDLFQGYYFSKPLDAEMFDKIYL